MMTMNKTDRINAMADLGKCLAVRDEAFELVAQKAYLENNWFTEKNIDLALNSICNELLDQDKLSVWADSYPVNDATSKKIGLILAGNIPLVGFHDLLAVFISGHHAVLKLSSRDEVLMKFLLEKLTQTDSRTKYYFELTDRLLKPDAVIATGSNNSSRYFEYYFGKYPHIIRKNRNSIGIFTGDETTEQLHAFSHDLLDFFGLGCRNISKIYVPEKYDFRLFWETLASFEELKFHNKYMNNYDYNHAIYLLNREKFLTNGFLIIKEDISLVSRISCLHYEHYEKPEQVAQDIENRLDHIQCIVSSTGKLTGNNTELCFGESQTPGLFDYADGVDTMHFLTSLP